MKCPTCGSELQYNENIPGFAICYKCKKKYKIENHNDEAAEFKQRQEIYANEIAKEEKKSKKKHIIIFAIILFIAFAIFIGNSIEHDSEKVNSEITATDISEFEYTLNDDCISINDYNGYDSTVIIADTYIIDEKEYTVTELDLTVFNGKKIKTLYLPSTLNCLYDITLAYLHSDEYKIDLYFQGSEDEWNNIFTEYEIADAQEEWENGNYEKAGEAAAQQYNTLIGTKYDASQFLFHYNSSISNVK